MTDSNKTTTNNDNNDDDNLKTKIEDVEYDIQSENEDGQTLLILAAEDGDEAKVSKLISMGADINKTDNDSMSPLLKAAYGGHTKIVKILIQLKVNINQAKNDGRSPLYLASSRGHVEVVKMLLDNNANVHQLKRGSVTPLFIASRNGHVDCVNMLLDNHADINQYMKTGVTPLMIAIYRQHNQVENVLRARGATLPTENMDLDTVDDVVNFFKLLNIQPDQIPQFEKQIREKNIDAKKFFSINTAESMDTMLNITNETERLKWRGRVFFHLMKNHQKIQNDRKEVTGAVERAKEAIEEMFNEEGKQARQKLFKLQSELYLKYINHIIPNLVNVSDDSTNDDKLQNNNIDVESETNTICKQVIDVAGKEDDRLGGKVISMCTEKYKTLRERWEYLEHLPEIPDHQKQNMQPIKSNQIGNDVLLSVDATDRNQESIKRLVMLSKYFHHFFKKQMELLVHEVNNAKNPQELGLDYNDFILPFNDDLLLKNGKRSNLTLGPIKQMARSLVKAKEYEEEMNEGKKDKKLNGFNISPADYIIDILRCTIEVEDPYLVAVIYSLLLKKEIATCLQICRVKNKFIDAEESNLQTNIPNILINLALLYPHNDDEFNKSGLKGNFIPLMSGKCMLICELQITMQDFLLIKRLSHSYYDISRIKEDKRRLRNFLFDEGVFIDTQNWQQKVPKVVKEFEKKHGKDDADKNNESVRKEEINDDTEDEHQNETVVTIDEKHDEQKLQKL